MDNSDSDHQVWLTTKEASLLLDTPVSTLKRHLKEGRYISRLKEGDRRGAYQILLSSLPIDAQRKWLAGNGVCVSIPLVRKQARQMPHLVESPEEYRFLWASYEKHGGKIKERAKAALFAVTEYSDMRGYGLSVGTAEEKIRLKYGFSKPTLWRYLGKVNGHPREHWLPLLAPRYTSRGKEAEFTDEAYQWILSRYLTTSKTKVSVLVRLAREEGKGKGWIIPSEKTVKRRLDDVPAPVAILGREGPKALEASFPTVERDYTSLALHEFWESDGRRLDIMCRWPDGSIGRPFLVIWRELRSRMVLSAKGYKDPCGELVMVSFRDAVEACNVVPKFAKIDNGREYANKTFSGQQKTRYRFKVTPYEQVGVATLMGVKMEWSPPGKGRDKPIESFWNFIADNVDKLPEFQGAYVGKNTVSKPEDFDPKNAVPIALVNQKLLDAIKYFNLEKKHRGNGMNSKAPIDIYTELMASAKVMRPDPAHMRLLLMAVRMVKPSRIDATFEFSLEGYGSRRYWSESFAERPISARDKKYAVWYHPGNPDASVSIYEGDVHVCDCQPLDVIPFSGAQEEVIGHVNRRSAYERGAKNELKEIRGSGGLILEKPDMELSSLGTPQLGIIEKKESTLAPQEKQDTGKNARLEELRRNQREERLEEERRATEKRLEAEEKREQLKKPASGDTEAADCPCTRLEPSSALINTLRSRNAIRNPGSGQTRYRYGALAGAEGKAHR